MATLVLTSRRIDLQHNGYDLRVAQLSAQIPGERHLVVVPLQAAEEGVTATLDPSRIFARIEVYEDLVGAGKRVGRHLRWSNDRFLARAHPREFRAIRARLGEVVRDRRIDRIVAFGGHLVELVADFEDCELVCDICDSEALTRQRALAHAGGRLRPGNLLDGLELWRAERTEAGLPDRCDQVTTVSAVDTATLLDLHGATDNVHTVPNGVDAAYLAPMPRPGTRRGVAFWGNLDFPPNANALAWFIEHHLPALRAAGVELCVIGASAPDWLRELARREPLIELAGFVPDLRAAVTDFPVMINPMRTGSGLKNKVLEAFGLGLAVVSTPMGVEALSPVRDGEHLVVVPDGADFGAAVLDLLADEPRRARLRAGANALLHRHYRWSEVGRVWAEVLAAAGPRGAAAIAAGALRGRADG
jgi:glycosyltransferase involved in cell wall biosynthesis